MPPESGGLAEDTRSLPSTLPEALDAANTAVPDPSPNQLTLLRQIEALRQRLLAGGLQIAVLGQFKRGKSTLLNAMLGMPLLPSGVLPVTAVATFLRAGPGLRVHVTSAGSRHEEAARDASDVQDKLQKIVTERGNPNNIQAVSRVDVSAPAVFLQSGIVLIDTPGIGSTFQHNTVAAEAILPECDACLFVVSPDPPITEVEIDYLRRIKKHVAKIIVVLNKIDAIEEEDWPSSIEFLRDVLTEQADLREVQIFTVSARLAVRAGADRDDALLRKSGLPVLTGYLENFLAREKQAVLGEAVARKAAGLIGELAFETEALLQSLRLPLNILEERLATFREAAPRFESDRRITMDRVAGDRRRALERLEALARQARVEGLAVLHGNLHDALTARLAAEEIRPALARAADAFFTARFRTLADELRTMLDGALSASQKPAEELIDLIRGMAARLLDIPVRTSAPIDAFAEQHQPYWTASGRTETVMPFQNGALDGLLPAAIRRARLGRRLEAEVDVLVTRNVENLRWSMMRNLDDVFGRFAAQLDERLAMTLRATRGAMESALERRARVADQTATELNAREISLRRLTEIHSALLKVAERN
jgi:dynamin family protein